MSKEFFCIHTCLQDRGIEYIYYAINKFQISKAPAFLQGRFKGDLLKFFVLVIPKFHGSCYHYFFFPFIFVIYFLQNAPILISYSILVGILGLILIEEFSFGNLIYRFLCLEN